MSTLVDKIYGSATSKSLQVDAILSHLKSKLQAVEELQDSIQAEYQSLKKINSLPEDFEGNQQMWWNWSKNKHLNDETKAIQVKADIVTAETLTQ